MSALARSAAALFEDRDSRLWVASRDGSVFRRDEDGFNPQFAETQIPSKVRSITQDSNGTLWFGILISLAALLGGSWGLKYLGKNWISGHGS